MENHYEFGTADFHAFEYLGAVSVLPSFKSSTSDVTQCTDNTTGTPTPIDTMACPSDRDCCAAQYSPTKQGCTTVDGSGCCLLGAALTPDENSTLPNCLVMGDSVSIGYEAQVATQLAGVCNVQHSPWDVSNGGWGSSSAARNCLDIMLLSATSKTVSWDVIFFNNGLHNLGDNSTAAVASYKDDMEHIADTLLASGATILYGLTTPQMTVYNDGSQIVEMLNAAATDVMTARDIPITDLYERVVDYCGGDVPYTYCDICSDYPNPCDYHYTNDGYKWIAQNVSDAITAALLAAPP